MGGGAETRIDTDAARTGTAEETRAGTETRIDTDAARTDTAEETLAGTDGAGGSGAGPMVLTDEQARVRALAGQSGALPPVPTVEELRELSARVEMSIPAKFKRDEFIYHYKDMAALGQELVRNGGIWQVVTRSNHSHIPGSWFHPGMGAVVFRDTVLCFARREWEEHAQKETARDLSMRMDKMQRATSYGEAGREYARMEIMDEGELRKLGRGYGASPDEPGMALERTEDVDFEEV